MTWIEPVAVAMSVEHPRIEGVALDQHLDVRGGRRRPRSDQVRVDDLVDRGDPPGVFDRPLGRHRHRTLGQAATRSDAQDEVPDGRDERAEDEDNAFHLPRWSVMPSSPRRG